MRRVTVIAHKSEPVETARYALRLPVIFHWGEEMSHVEGGFTKDIGRDNAFVLSGKCPPIGSYVRIEVLVPSPDHLPGALRLECLGRVTHVVRGNGYSGFLFHGRFYDGLIREDYFWPLDGGITQGNEMDVKETSDTRTPGDFDSTQG